MDAHVARINPDFKVLVVEDDPEVADHVGALLRGWGYAARISGDGQDARTAAHEWTPDLALVDLGLPDVDGFDLLREFRANDIESIVMSARPSVNIAVETITSGASAFLEKPVSPFTLRSMIAVAERRSTLTTRATPREPDPAPKSIGELLSASPKMDEVFDLIRCVAPTEASVLITGENGTGKELVANAIHALSPRRAGPFVKINCAAIPAELIESELFGHRRGAFTGAIGDHVGLFESAAGGTLLLDEIGEMPSHLQTKLLRVLQDRQARPVGGVRSVNLDFRLICATNSDLRSAAAGGQFRQDLYFRINTISIPIPALRDRPEDVLLLAAHFLGQFADRYSRGSLQMDDAVRAALLAHDWPGNVRELEHALEHAVIVSRGARVQLDDLPESLHQRRRAAATPATAPMMPLAELERLAIMRTLEHTGGNKRAAAAILGVYRPTLYSKLRKYGIYEPSVSREE
jgi:DNA-binding NtrC family response regulator